MLALLACTLAWAGPRLEVDTTTEAYQLSQVTRSELERTLDRMLAAG